ncbi:MAG: ABC transporter permease [Oscillospiraceae bacterium]
MQETVFTTKKQSQLKQIWKQFRKNKAAMVGLVIISLLLLIAIFADVIVDYDTVVIAQNSSERMQAPSGAHWFGTDNYGRDIFARVIHGARMSLTIGIVTTIISVFFGGVLGALAGFYGGKVDNIISRVMDALICIPATLMALCIIAALGTGLVNIMIAITVSQIPGFTRLIRSVIMTLRDQDYIEAARSCGTSDFRIITKHIIPNALGPIIVQGTMAMADMILTAAGLGFLGMGIAPPAPEWGTMLSEGREFIRTAPYIITFPGVAIVLTALSFNMLGDGLRDALDPRLKD